jgi:solute carrier family 35 (UDP-sugar transporter), member A1/2/3
MIFKKNKSLGGIIIAVVIKFADNILKNFATAISIIFSAVISALFMGFQLNGMFLVGVVLVNYAVYLYGMPDPVSAITAQQKEKDLLLGDNKA